MVANGNSHQEMASGLISLDYKDQPLSVMSHLINTNGGHSGGYIYFSFGYLISDLGVVVGSYWTHICSGLARVSCVCSLAIE